MGTTCRAWRWGRGAFARCAGDGPAWGVAYTGLGASGRCVGCWVAGVVYPVRLCHVVSKPYLRGLGEVLVWVGRLCGLWWARFCVVREFVFCAVVGAMGCFLSTVFGDREARFFTSENGGEVHLSGLLMESCESFLVYGGFLFLSFCGRLSPIRHRVLTSGKGLEKKTKPKTPAFYIPRTRQMIVSNARAI